MNRRRFRQLESTVLLLSGLSILVALVSSVLRVPHARWISVGAIVCFAFSYTVFILLELVLKNGRYQLRSPTNARTKRRRV